MTLDCSPTDPITAEPPAEPRRPRLAVRVGIGVVGGLLLLFNAALMISDRAPGATRLLFGDLVRSLSRRIDAGGRADFRSDARRLANDAAVHLGVWAIALIFVALAVWTWRGLLLSVPAVFVASVVVEFGQGLFSSTRSVERSDVFFNAVGVAVGAAVVALVLAVWSLATTEPADRRARLIR